MIFHYRDTDIHYSLTGTGKPVVLLHGWGQNRGMMAPIEEHLKKQYRVINLDFPGFGESPEPKEAWGVADYTAMLEALLKEEKLENPILIAHSFGARVAILYASKNPVCKMVLTGAAGIRPKRGISYYLKVYSYKLAKRILSLPFLKRYQTSLLRQAGSSDYQSTSGIMRATFVKVVNQDLTDCLKQIKAETLLVWGENDTAVPLSDGKKMEALIPNCGLAVFENDDHFAYWHQMDRFLRVIDIFLASKE